MKPEFIHRDGMIASTEYVQWLSDLKNAIFEEITKLHQVGAEIPDIKWQQAVAKLVGSNSQQPVGELQVFGQNGCGKVS